MSPQVSVLLPCHDAEGTLEEALESLFAQTFGDFEILAIDDGSRDGTLRILHKAARRDHRIHLLQQPHRGIVAALRNAMSHSEAPLLARMDADDRCHPERLRLQVERLQASPDVALVGSRVELFPRDELSEGLLRYESWVNSVITDAEIRRDLFVESPLPHPSVVIRRDALESVGGYRDVRWPEDYDLWMRLARAGCRLEKHPEVLLEWCDSPERASRRDPVYALERFVDLKEHYLVEALQEQKRPLAIWGTGPVGKEWSRRLRRRGFSVRRLVDLDPRKVGQRIHGANVVSDYEVHHLRDHLILVAVGALSRKRDEGSPWMSAREEIRERLTDEGFVERRDFLCVA